MTRYLTTLSTLALCLASATASANPDVTSREYKLMLDASLFSYDTEAATVSALVQDMETAIEQAIARNVSGTPVLEKQREVRFFDTEGTCALQSRGYSFRERVENGASEVTLKFRSPDRYIADFEDVTSATVGAETKLESDGLRSLHQGAEQPNHQRHEGRQRPLSRLRGGLRTG